LSAYKGQTLKVTGSSQRAADDVVVNTDVVDPKSPSAQRYKAAFRVRKATDGHPIVTDIQIEGIWLSLSQRSDFTGFLQQHNGRIGDLIADLKRCLNLSNRSGFTGLNSNQCPPSLAWANGLAGAKSLLSIRSGHGSRSRLSVLPSSPASASGYGPIQRAVMSFGTYSARL